jgi:hypothetical protein
VKTFYSDGVVFEGSMARCHWETGMQIDSSSSAKESVVAPVSTHSEIRSHWSNDSLSNSDIVFDSPPEGESYGRWSDYESADASWTYDSPTSSRGFSNLNPYDSPRTPPSTRSSLSSSGSQSGSLPATPNSIDTTFGGRMDTNPKVLHINTDYCNTGYYNDRMTSSCSTDSSMMHTAVEYNPLSTSFYLASPVIRSLALSSNTEHGKAPPPPVEDREMEVISWTYSSADLSLRSFSRQQSSHDSRIECDREECDDSPSTVFWPEYRPPQPIPSSPPPNTFAEFNTFSDFTPTTNTTNSTPTRPPFRSKKSSQTSTRSSFFRFLPRSPPSPSSLITRKSQMYTDGSSLSRGRSPSPAGVWISPRSTVPVLNPSQDGGVGWRRRTKVPGRLWFSPGKLFSGLHA